MIFLNKWGFACYDRLKIVFRGCKSKNQGRYKLDLNTGKNLLNKAVFD